MESIKELREICQKSRLWADTWHGRHIARPASIYLTAVFLRLGLSANTVTGIFLASGIAGSLLMAFGNRVLFFAGTIMLQLWYILDHCDGEVARYRKQTSFTGIYFDAITHYISHPLIFFCTGLGLYVEQGNIRLFIAAVVAGYSVCMLSVLEDILSTVLYNNAQKGVLTKPSGSKSKNETMPDTNIFKNLFSFSHKLCTFPIIMNILFFSAVINLFIGYNIVNLVVLFYAFAATFVWVARFFVFIMERRPDKLLGNEPRIGEVKR